MPKPSGQDSKQGSGKPTPGPWPIKQTSDHCWNVTIGEQPISILREANARLIAVAPELLASLKECRYHLGIIVGPNDDAANRAILEADEAIAKAERRAQ